MAGLSLLLIAAAATFWVTREDGADEPPNLTSPAARQDLAARALDDLQGAVQDRAATELDPSAGDLAEAAVTNAGELRVADFTLRYVDEDTALTASLPQGQWAAAVDATWRFSGFDAEPAHAEVTFVFEVAPGGERATVVDIGGGDRRTPLWLTGPAQVHRSADALVLVTGDEPVGTYAKRARIAVRQVRRVVPRWSQKLVIEVPDSSEQLDEVLNADAGDYTNIAAVTTTVDGTLSPSAPVHVFVNPQVMDGLERGGAQVVTTHELVHVATGAATSSDTPLWLLEGFADYVALREVRLPLGVTAGQIIAQVRSEGVPKALPAGDEFDTRTARLGAAYESAWLACRVLARAGSESQLLRLYREVADGAELDRALRSAFGFGERGLVQRWRAELRQLAG